MEINNNKAYIVGAKTKSNKWSEEEINEQIDWLTIVIEYFRGRKDSDILVKTLNSERADFLNTKRAKSRNHELV